MNRYWVGGTGSWADSSHWSASSGGAGGASVPTSSDDVYFDANSASGTFVVTVNTANCAKLDTSGLTNNLTLTGPSGSNSLGVYGDITLSSRTTISLYVMAVLANVTFTQNSALVNSLQIGASGIPADVTMTLAQNTTINTLVLRDHGYLDTNDLNYNGAYIQVLAGSGGKSNGGLIIDNSTITLTTAWIGVSGMFVSATNSTIRTPNFTGGNKTYNNLTLTATGTITDTNTFNTLEFTPGITTTITTGGSSATTETVSSFVANGTSLQPITIRSSTTGLQHVFVKTSGTVNATHIDLKDSVALGGATWNATSSTDSGHNANWNFIGPQVPVANFTGAPTSALRPSLVSFTDTTTGTPDTWLWDFGDGNTSTSQNPTNNYTIPGTYTVSLTASNSLGSDVEVKTGYITVTKQTFTATASGAMTFSGDAIRHYKAIRQAAGTMTFSGNAILIRHADTSNIEKKTFLYKVYDESNNFLGVWDDVIDEPNWSAELNTTGSTTTVILARNSDSLNTTTDPLRDSDNATIKDNNNFDILTTLSSKNKVGPGSTVNHNYRVDVYTFYGSVDTIDDNFGLPIQDNLGEDLQGTIGAPNGIRKFSGFIAEINTKYGDEENTEVLLMSYGFDLDQYAITNGSGATTVPYNSQDPSQMVKTGLTQFAVDAAGKSFTTYSTASVANTATSTSYTFKVNTYKELLDTAVKLAPSNWFYYVGLGDNLVRFKAKPTEAQHTFYLGKHFKSLNLRSYIGSSVNKVLFTGGGDPALYKSYVTTPATGTRAVLDRLSDNRVTLETSGDILSQGEIDENNKVQYRAAIDILDKTYDIETIELGDVVAFRNFGNYVDSLLLQVVAYNYTPDVITLQLDTLPPSVPQRLEELRKALDAQENETAPATPDS